MRTFNPHQASCLTLLALSLLLGGCQPHTPGDTGESPGAMDAPAEFVPGKGLSIAPATVESLGLETATATCGTFAERCQAKARILGDSGTTGLLLRAVVPQEEVPARGQTVELRADGTSETTTGTVAQTDRQLLTVVGGVEVLIQAPASSRPQLTGKPLRVSYQLGEERESVSVPAQSLVRAALGNFVYVADDGYYCRRRVEPGQENEGRVEIHRGLSANERVVTTGANDLWLLELSLVGGMSNLEEPQTSLSQNRHD